MRTTLHSLQVATPLVRFIEDEGAARHRHQARPLLGRL